MPGLVPGIHVFPWIQKKDVDGRYKPGHDEMIHPPNPGSAHCSICAGPTTCFG
jgi:hypothetical protein